jgi:hypothetical protein
MQSYNVTGTPTFASGSTYFQSHSNAAPEQGCTISACTPFGGVSPTMPLAQPESMLNFLFVQPALTALLAAMFSLPC